MGKIILKEFSHAHAVWVMANRVILNTKGLIDKVSLCSMNGQRYIFNSIGDLYRTQWYNSIFSYFAII